MFYILSVLLKNALFLRKYRRLMCAAMEDLTFGAHDMYFSNLYYALAPAY